MEALRRGASELCHEARSTKARTEAPSSLFGCGRKVLGSGVGGIWGGWKVEMEVMGEVTFLRVWTEMGEAEAGIFRLWPFWCLRKLGDIHQDFSGSLQTDS